MSPHDVLADPVAQPAVPAPPRSSKLRFRIRKQVAWLIGRTWFWPTLLTLALGAYKIGRPELWRDELRSWSAASRSVGDLFHLLGNTDAAVALYYLILHYWMEIFGDSATSMRMVSTLAMAGAAACVSLIGQRLFDRRTAIAAGLIFAFVPSVSRFAQEVRPYSLTMLVAALSTLLLLRAVEKGGWPRFLWYGLSIAVLALTQIVATPILLAHAVGIYLWRRDRRTVILWVGSVAVGLVLAAPIVLLSASQYQHQVGSLPDATILELTVLPARLFASGAVAGAVVILSAFAWRKYSKAVAFATAWALLPIGAIWLASNLGDSYWMTRYMLFILPGLAMLAGAAITSMGTRMAVIGLVVLVFMGLQDQRAVRWLGAHDQWNYPDSLNQAVMYSEAAAIIAKKQRPGDGVVYAAREDYWLFDIGLAYQLRGHPQPRDVFVDQTALERGDFWPTECPEPAQCLGTVSRIWLVSSYVPKFDADPFAQVEPAKKKDALLRDYSLTETYLAAGIKIQLLERNPA